MTPEQQAEQQQQAAENASAFIRFLNRLGALGVPALFVCLLACAAGAVVVGAAILAALGVTL